MLKIRLRRTGAHKRPNYRIVVAESSSPRDGRYIEIIGTYDPLSQPSSVRIDADKAQGWLGKGARPSERVAKLLVREGIADAARLGLKYEPGAPSSKADAAVADQPLTAAPAGSATESSEEPVAAPADEAVVAATSETAEVPVVPEDDGDGVRAESDDKSASS